jgi:hypothetical protein
MWRLIMRDQTKPAVTLQQMQFYNPRHALAWTGQPCLPVQGREWCPCSCCPLGDDPLRLPSWKIEDPPAAVSASEARLLLLCTLCAELHVLPRPMTWCPAAKRDACVGLLQECCCAMCCMAANFARSLRATAPMLRWDQS